MDRERCQKKGQQPGRCSSIVTHRRIQRGGPDPPFWVPKIHCNCMSTGDKGIAKKQHKFKILAYYVRIPTFSDTDLAQVILYMASTKVILNINSDVHTHTHTHTHTHERTHKPTSCLTMSPREKIVSPLSHCSQIFRVDAVAVQGMARMLGVIYTL